MCAEVRLSMSGEKKGKWLVCGLVGTKVAVFGHPAFDRDEFYMQLVSHLNYELNRGLHRRGHSVTVQAQNSPTKLTLRPRVRALPTPRDHAHEVRSHHITQPYQAARKPRRKRGPIIY